MHKQEKKVFYQTSNIYSTLNNFSTQTKSTWLVCHGLGYLSRFFITYFKTLNPAENYIIAPQAPSKYYQSSSFKYVGSSWLTKENTQAETKNVLAYLDAVYEAEKNNISENLIIFGFSQGVSVSMRWMASRKIEPKVLVIYAGSIPKELKPSDFSYLKNPNVKVIYGLEDQYITAEKIKSEREFAENLFGKENIEIIPFEGKHEVKSAMIEKIIS